MPSLELEGFALEVKFDGPEFASVMEQNLVIGISAYGIGSEATAPIQVSVLHAIDAPFELAVQEYLQMSVAYAVPLNDGSLLLTYSIGDGFDFAYIEVYGCLTENGTYIPFAMLSGKKGGSIRNIPIGITFYLKIRAVNNNGNTTEWLQVRRGKISSGNIACEIRAIKGSVIPKGAIFSVVDYETGNFVALMTQSEIVITDAITISLEGFDLEFHDEDYLITNNIVVGLHAEDLEIDLFELSAEIA